MTNQEKIKKFGNPGENLATFNLPFKMYLSWDLKTSVNRITVHKNYGQSLIDALKLIHDSYGIDFIKEMGLDVYGGAYNNRKMRGSKDKLSMHAFGCAVDFDPKRNDLRGVQKHFLEQKYEKILDILEMHGWYNLGRYKGYDSMHFSVEKGN